MSGGLTIGGKSLADLGQCIASRSTGTPERKGATATVPGMSGFYDFSKLGGAVAYESREVTYTIEMIGDDREDLQDQKTEVLEWLSQVVAEEISDDDTPGRHFVGSFDSADWDEGDDGESGTLEVTFLCHPFLVADEETTQALSVGANTVSNSGQPVRPTAKTSSGSATVTIGGVSQSVSTTPVTLTAQLMSGDNSVQVSGAAVTLSWRVESM